MMNCEELEKYIKEVDELLKWHEEQKRKGKKLTEAADRAADFLDDLGPEIPGGSKVKFKPKFKKALDDLRKLGKSLEDYFDEGSEGELTDEERTKRWEQTRDNLQQKYEECNNPWTGEISSIIIGSELSLSEGMTVKEFTYRKEQNWRIIGTPENTANGNSTYKALWSATEYYKLVFFEHDVWTAWADGGHDGRDVTTTDISSGKVESSSLVTIRINQRRYTLTTPKSEHLGALTRKITTSPATNYPAISNPIYEDSKDIQGQLDSSGLLSAGSKKGPISVSLVLWGADDVKCTEVLKWQLRRNKGEPKKEIGKKVVPIKKPAKKKPPKKPGRLKPIPL